MMLICPQQNDAFTVNDTTNGNGALTYPIGLITTDEVVLAGGWYYNNNGHYLYSGSWYWASSPVSFNGWSAYIHGVDSTASNLISMNIDGGVRPVLNLSLDVLNNGDGSMNDPYHL